MLKIALFVVLVGLARAAEDGGLNWDEIPVANNGSQCIFRLDVGALSCRSANQSVIECPAVIVIPEGASDRSEVVGIARTEKVRDENIKTEAIRYFLYPRAMQNETYSNHSIVVNNKPVDIFLYFSENSTMISGVRIRDLKCYRRLVTLFDESAQSPHEVQIGEEKVEMLGEMLVAGKSKQKRFLGRGFGFGFGRGFGFGLGFGLPFFGFPFLGMPFLGK